MKKKDKESGIADQARKEKTYKFLAIAYNVDPSKLPASKTSRLMKVKAYRSDTAEKIAMQRIEKLQKQTGFEWTPHREPPRMSARAEKLQNPEFKVPAKWDKLMRIIKLLQKIDAEVQDAARSREGMWNKWNEFRKFPGYSKALPYVRAFLGLGFAAREFGINEDLDVLIEVAIKMAPLFINRFEYSEYRTEVTAIQWFKAPQPAMKGDIPWMIMHTEYGRRRVRKAMTAEFGSRLMEVLRETVTGLHRIGLMSTKDKDEILKGRMQIGIRPLEESFDNFVHTAEAIQRGEKVKVQKGICFENEKALRKVLGKNTNLSKKDIAALAKLAAERKIRLPIRAGGVKPFEGVSVKGESIVKTMIKDRR